MHQNVAICLYVSLLLRMGTKNGVVFEAPSVAYVGNYHTNCGIANSKFRYTCICGNSFRDAVNNNHSDFLSLVRITTFSEDDKLI